MKVCINHPSKLTTAELKQCRSISFRHNGELCRRLQNHKEEKSVKVIRAFDKGLLVGWALLFENDNPHRRKETHAFQLYVRKSYRRKGVGMKLFNAAAKKVGTQNIIYWTDTPGSTEFYHHCFAPSNIKKEVVQKTEYNEKRTF